MTKIIGHFFGHLFYLKEGKYFRLKITDEMCKRHFTCKLGHIDGEKYIDRDYCPKINELNIAHYDSLADLEHDSSYELEEHEVSTLLKIKPKF